MQGAGIYKFDTVALMDAYTPPVSENAAIMAYPLDEDVLYYWDSTVWVRLTQKVFTWYEGGDSMRVWATFDVFTSGYTKNSAGDYDFVIPMGEQLDRIEWVITTGVNTTALNDTIIKVTTPTGNTTPINSSSPTVVINSASGGVLHSGEQALGGTTAGVSSTGGTVTVSLSQLNAHNTRKASITNLIQNA